MLKRNSSNSCRGVPGRPFEKGAWERRVVGRAREAVSVLLRSNRGTVAGGDGLDAAVGAVLLAASVVLGERFLDGENSSSPLRDFLEDGLRKVEGARLRAILREAAGRHSILSEGLLGRGRKLFLHESLSQEASARLLSFLDAVVAEEAAHDEWAALRLLGTIYEASLGWEASEAGLARNTERVKALGAVYTPSGVAGLIVEATLRPLLSGSTTPDALEAVSVLDPACGAGVFLLEALRVLEGEAVRRCSVGPNRIERLPWRRRVAANCLSGVDIDPAAVHLTRLVLWLASGGGEETAAALRRSARVGDALVGAWRSDLDLAGGAEGGPDALRRAMDAWCDKFFAPEARPPAIHWELEFPDRFPPCGRGSGGWRAVVGNPPYVGSQALSGLAPYLRARFPETYTGYNDLSAFFFHRGLELLSPGGRLGFIAPSYWFQNTYGEKLRRYVLATSRIEEVFDFGPLQVFPGRGVHTAAAILSKVQQEEGEGVDGHLVRYRRLEAKDLAGVSDGSYELDVRVPQASLHPSRWVFAPAQVKTLLRKAQRVGRPLTALFHIEKGPTSGCNGVFTMNKKELEKHGIEHELLRPCLKNGDIRRYGPLAPMRWLLYLDGAVEVERYPGAAAYLEANRSALASRNEARRGRHPWWRMERPRKRALFEAPAKLVVPYRAPANRFTLDELGCFNDGGDIRVLVPRVGVGRSTLLAALAIANSALGTLVYKCLGKPKGEMLEFFVKPLASAPFGPPLLPSQGPKSSAHLSAWLDEEGPGGLVEKVLRQRGGEALVTPALALLADRMLALHRDGGEPGVIAEADEAIDRMVARLFGLTTNEEALAAAAARETRERGAE